MPSSSRNLFRAALVIFVITIMIGILNGIDIWDPPRDTLLTHVHAGTLGWITLGVFAGAIWMFEGDESTKVMANYSILAVAAYVLAFWSVELTDTVSIQRPIGGTLAFIAIAWVFWWALRSMRGRAYDVAEFGMILALGFLAIGAVLGILLGLQLADVEIVDPAKSSQLYDSHPGAMIAGFVVLAGLAFIEWLMPDREVPSVGESRTGAAQMLALFVAGLLFVAGSLFAVDPLLQIAGALQLVGVLILIGRFRKSLAPSRWRAPVENLYVRTAVIGLVIVLGLVLYFIGQVSTGTEFEEVSHIAIAFDHLNFMMVITNLFFAMLAMTSVVSSIANAVIYWGMNVGVLGFAIGLIAESDVVKRVFTPVLGVALLYGIFTHLTAEPTSSAGRDTATV